MIQPSDPERQVWLKKLIASLQETKDRWLLRAEQPIGRMRCCLVATTLGLALLPDGVVLSAAPAPCAAIGKVPMLVVGNAPIVLLQLRRQNGTTRTARFVFDSGGGAVLLDETLASDLGLKPSGAEITDSGERFAPVDLEHVMIGEFAVNIGTSKAYIHRGSRSFDRREHVEGLLPGKALELYQVVVDYPHLLFTVAAAGCLNHRGVEVDSLSLPASGHPRVVIRELNRGYGLLLDTGSRVTLFRKDLLVAWSHTHPELPLATGASGTANMGGDNGAELLLRVPELEWGPFHLRSILVASRPDETYSLTNFETPEPIMGALGGNVLMAFRVEIDYPDGRTYLEKLKDPDPDDMNSAGLVVDVDARDQLVVVAISSTAAVQTKRNVQAGDIILRIAGEQETPWAITDASLALAGKVGRRIPLLILRKGRQVHTTVRVVPLL